MRQRLVPFAFLALAALPVAAQEAATEAPAETPAEADQAPAAAAPAAPAGPPTSREEAQVGQPYVVETFTDWTVRCIRLDQPEDLCEMHQPLFDDSGTRTAEINIFPLDRGDQVVAGGTVVTPLETLLPEGVRMSVDGGETRVYPFTFCNRVGCVAQVGFRGTEVDQFRRGRSALVQIVPLAAPDQTVALQMSLSGFTAAFEALRGQ